MKSFNPRHTLILASLLTLALLLSIMQPLPVLDDVSGRVIYAEDSNGAALSSPLQVNPAGLVEEPLAEPESGLQEDGEQPPASSEDNPADDGADEGTEGAEPPEESTVGNEDSGTSTDTTGGSTGSETTEGSTEGGTTEATLPPTVTEESQTIASETVPDEASPAFAPLQAEPPEDPRPYVSFDAYYIQYDSAQASEKGPYRLDLIGDKTPTAQSVKYQLEFHNDIPLAKGDVEIKMPYSLYTDRQGQAVKPASIGVPQEPYESQVSPFNYSISDDGQFLVFSNIRPISAGRNNLVQVRYQLNDMQTPDGSPWTLEPEVTVRGLKLSELKPITPLVGSMDTEVELRAVEKRAYSDNHQYRYYPELYSWNHVLGVLHKTAEECPKPSDFDDYKYLLWQTRVELSASQPWSLTVTDTPELGGEVVGYVRYNENPQLDRGYIDTKLEATYTLNEQSSYGLSSQNANGYIYTVVRYPKNNIPTDSTTIPNTIKVTVTGLDDKEERTLESTSKRIWQDYQWNYVGKKFAVEKTYDSREDDTEVGYTSVLREKMAAGMDMELPRPWHMKASYLKGHKEDVSQDEYTAILVDDLLYVKSNLEEYKLLGPEDYYYSQIQFSLDEHDINLYGDETWPVSDGEPVTIQVQTADQPDVWQEVAKVPFTEISSYQIPDPWPGLGIYRIRVEHKSSRYELKLHISAKTVLRATSPTLKAMLDDTNVDTLTLLNLDGGYYRGPDGKDHFPERHDGELLPGVDDFDKQVYGGPLYRAKATVTLNSVTGRNTMQKFVKTSQDTIHGRVNMDYVLLASEGYDIYSLGVDYLKSLDLSVGRQQVYFYDLLPLGMKFNPQVPVTVGSPDMFTPSKANPDSWNQEQYSVDWKVVDNYKGSGRQLLRFCLNYSGEDGSRISSGPVSREWYQSWGLRFGAFYSWNDYSTANEASNVAAFNTIKKMIGKSFPDDGTGLPAGTATDPELLKDVDGNGEISGFGHLIYATAVHSDDLTLAAQSGIEKFVKADADSFMVPQKEASVEVGKGYTYTLQVRVIQNGGKAKDIVIFDHLEDGETTSWKGSFDGLDLSELKLKGINPKVYYSASESASHGDWTSSGDWTPSDQWTQELSAVKSLAIDISQDKDGQEFILQNGQSISCGVHMKAPEQLQEANYAFNRASFSSKQAARNENFGVSREVTSASTKVSLFASSKLSIEKKLAEDTPAIVKDESFAFSVSLKGSPLADKEYELWAGKDKLPGIHATDADGQLFLKAGQTARFPSLPAGAEYKVTELTGGQWSSDNGKTRSGKLEGNQESSVCFTNTYQPTLYFEKRLKYAQDYTNSGDKFSFVLKLNGLPAGGREYYLFTAEEAEKQDTALPPVIDDKPAQKTDESGGFQLTAGQRAAFILPPQSDYSVKEIDIPEDYNQEVQRTVTGHLEMENVFAFLSNEYLYKDLFVKKTVQCAEGVVLPDETFTFELKLNDQPAAGVEYILYGPDSEKAGQMKEIERDKHLPDNGQFTLKDGQEIRLIKLPKGASYEVSELLTDEQQKNYRMSSENASGKLPLYAPFAKASFNNQYLIKNLEVSKTVIAPTDKDKSQVFTFVVTKNGEAMANTPYRLFGGETEVLDGSPFSTDGEGQFTLKHGQRAFLPGFREGDSYTVREEKADGYTQIAPKDSEGFSGTVDPSMQNTKVAFRNLNKDNSDVLIFSKHIELDEPLSQRIYGDGKIKQKDFDISEIEKKDLDNLAKVEFTFQILVNEKPSESTTYTLIDAEGKESKKLTEVMNDKPGCFTLKADEMAIFKVPDKGQYEIKELLPEDDNDHYYYFIRAKSQSNEWYKIYGHWEVKEAPEAKAVSGNISDTGVTQTALTNLLKYDDFANARYLELHKSVNNCPISEDAQYKPYKEESEKLKHVPLRFHATFFDKEGQEVKVDKGLKWYKNKISFDNGIPSPLPTPLAESDEDGYIEVNFTQGDHGAIYLYYSDKYTVELEEALPPGHPAGELLSKSITEHNIGSVDYYISYTFENSNLKSRLDVEKQVLNEEDADKSFAFKIERRQPLTSIWNPQKRVYEKKIVFFPYAHASFMRCRAGEFYDPVTGQPETTDEQGRFTLHAGEFAVFQVPIYSKYYNYSNLPDSQPRFRVTEETYSDYVSQITLKENIGQKTFSGNCVVLTAKERAIFTNTHEETAGLSVSKTVTREEGQIAPIPDQSFRFKLAVNGQPWKNKNYRLYDSSGKEIENKRKVKNEKVIKGVDEIKPWTTDSLGRFSLKDGERAVFDWIGAGKNYEITEFPAKDFVQTVPAEGHSLSGVIPQKGEVLGFTNMYKNPERKGELIVRKQLQLPVGISDYPEESFDFKVEIGGKPFNSWSYDLYSEDGSCLEKDKQTDSEGKFSLQGKQYAVFKDVPPNQDYKVSEVPKKDSLYQVLSQNPQEGATTEASTDLCFVNGLSSLWVRKAVTNHSLQKPDPNEDFSFILTLDGQAAGGRTYWLYDKDLKKPDVKSCAADGSFTLKADESAIFFGIPKDTPYNLKESPRKRFSQTLPADLEGYRGKIDYSAKKLIFVNNFAPLPGLWLSKHVIDEDNHPVADIRSFSFKLSREGQPLAGKNYRLYATDGSPEPVLYQTNEEGVLQLRSGEKAYFERLEAGDYQAEELEVPKAYKPVEQKKSIPLNREGEDVRFDFVNKIDLPEKIYGNLVITNTVRPSGDKQSFHYILKLSDPGIQGLQGTLYEGGLKGAGILPDAANAKALGQLAFDDGKAEFSPSNNQKVELQGLQGTRYRASQEGARLLPAKANAEALGQLSFVDGKAEFDLSDNQWVHLQGLLAGTDYEVQEIENEDYRTTVQGQPGFSWKGRIEASKTAQVDYVNERVTPHIVKPCCPAPQTISQTTVVPGKRLYRLPRTGEGTNPAWGSLFGALLLLLGLSAIRRRH